MKLFKSNEVRQYQFIQIPKELLYSSRYKNLSSDAKLLYGLLLDRMELSRENNWINENGEIYLIFTRQEIESILSISHATCVKAFNQLKDAELIYEVRQGVMLPNLIFVAHIIYDTNQSIENTMMFKKHTSRNLRSKSQEVKNINTNNTNINNTDINLEEEETTLMVEVDKTVFNTYKECISKKVSDMELKTLGEFQSLVGKEILNKAIITASLRNGKNLEYIKRVIEDWYSRGFKTVEQVNQYLAEWMVINKKAKENKLKKVKRNSKDINTKREGSFNDYEQRQYNFEELEKKLLGWQ